MGEESPTYWKWYTSYDSTHIYETHDDMRIKGDRRRVVYRQGEAIPS